MTTSPSDSLFGMDLSHLSTIAHPGTSRRIVETNVVSHAIDAKGRPVTDPSSGRGVAVAYDQNGTVCAKIANQWAASTKDNLALIAQGAFHYQSNDARFRGVWIDLPDPEELERATTEENPAAHAPKKAAKKAAKKAV